jgi:hypothetical protein
LRYQLLTHGHGLGVVAAWYSKCNGGHEYAVRAHSTLSRNSCISQIPL